MRKKSETIKRTAEIYRLLKKRYPDAACALYFSNPMELLVATILSAQCTDKRVNRVTPLLFQHYPAVKSYASADPEELQGFIKTTGFYKNKARNIIGAAQQIQQKHHGEVPDRQEDLVQLPGVGRKTANVVLGNAYGIPGITVDTHMIRVNGRLGLTKHKDPVKIEFDLMEIVPKKEWTLYSHVIIHHGRNICIARNPKCPECPAKNLCPSYETFMKIRDEQWAIKQKK